MRFATDQFYFKTAEEMAHVFGELPDALERTVAIAERCNVRIDPVRNSFPEFKVPEGHTIDSYFERVAREGFAERVPFLEEARQAGLAAAAARGIREAAFRRNQDDHEDALRRLLPDRLGFHPLCARAGHSGWTRAADRPPAAWSAMRCTSPMSIRLQYDLLFERFLNPERVSMPDIDIDFCMRRRGEVIDYVTREIWPRQRGADHHVRHHGGQGRAQGRRPRAGFALRRRRSARQARSQSAQHRARRRRSSSPAQLRSAIEGDERFRDLLEVAKRLEGLARHASTHAAGVVISPQPLTDLLPALQDQSRRNHDAVRHEGPRAPGPAEDGFPRPDHAHRPLRHREAHRRQSRRAGRSGDAFARRYRHLPALLARRYHGHLPV